MTGVHAPDIRLSIVDDLDRAFESRQVPSLSVLVKPPGGSGEKVSRFTMVMLDDGSGGAAWNML